MDIKEELRIKKLTLHYENGELFLKATVRQLLFCTGLSSKRHYSLETSLLSVCFLYIEDTRSV